MPLLRGHEALVGVAHDIEGPAGGRSLSGNQDWEGADRRSSGEREGEHNTRLFGSQCGLGVLAQACPSNHRALKINGLGSCLAQAPVPGLEPNNSS
jgi:hypothetical protein